MNELPASLASAYPPDRGALLAALRGSVDDRLLLRIANADYGYQADVAYPMLVAIRNTCQPPKPPHGVVCEVLQLTRFSNAHDIDEHAMLLFACAALMRMDLDHNGGDSALDSTIGQAVASSRYFDKRIDAAVGRFFTAAFLETTNPQDRFFYALAASLILLRRGLRRTAELSATADWLLGLEEAARHPCGRFDPGDPPPEPFGLQSGFWRAPHAELCEYAAGIRSHELRERWELIAMSIE